ncbi:uncharacterized protein LOC133873327 [Alnus glutinosa]|uniref:uncharacterized protein LOC133873327 n=1 Tax=Alnus glutinosa TaxID=3517 RepID=UPI002D76B7F6|nr:uncharacterized protein LOC133873327 [Alnus glutinosa]
MSWSRLGNSKSNGGLGYRDMEVFNLALLAKQGWRLIQDPNSLLGTILRDKYYSGKTFQLAALGHNPSFAWRSILKARPTLENGLISKRDGGRTMCLENFDPVEAERISNLVPNPLLQEDRLIWRGTKHGHFSLRSAYFLEVERTRQDKGESSHHQGIQWFWKYIWSFSIPPVVKNFVWKVCNAILLIKESSRKVQKLSLEAEDSLGFIKELKDKLEEQYFGEVLITMRFIWLRRNSYVFGSSLETLGQVIQKVKGVMADLEDESQGEWSEVSMTSAPSTPRWVRPPVGMLKVNWDAALYIATKRLGVGVVVAAMTMCIPSRTDPATTEALAVWEAVRFYDSQGWQRVLFEGDAQSIVMALRKRGQC